MVYISLLVFKHRCWGKKRKKPEGFLTLECLSVHTVHKHHCGQKKKITSSLTYLISAEALLLLKKVKNLKLTRH